MLNWVNILHIYQPPHQSAEIVKKVASESYERIVELLHTYPQLKLTINITGSLIELLEAQGLGHILIGLREHAEKGQVELLGSAMYHPILPLIPAAEVRRQIALNDQILARTFGGTYTHKGFYLPEMAYSEEVGKLIKEAGFTFIVLDEYHSETKIRPAIRYRIAGSGLLAVFRDRIVSRTFPPEWVETNFETMPNPLVTTHDGELYGHWHKDDKGFYKKAFTDSRITFMTVSEFLASRTEEETITPRALTWETTPEDIAQGHIYPLWNHPENPLHEMLWHFTHTTRELVEGNTGDPTYSAARKKLDRGLASCMWWWASGRQVIDTSPVKWHPDEVEKGLQELLSATTLLTNVGEDTKTEMTAEHRRIVTYLRKLHEEKYAPKQAAV